MKKISESVKNIPWSCITVERVEFLLYSTTLVVLYCCEHFVLVFLCQVLRVDRKLGYLQRFLQLKGAEVREVITKEPRVCLSSISVCCVPRGLHTSWCQSGQTGTSRAWNFCPLTGRKIVKFRKILLMEITACSTQHALWPWTSVCSQIIVKVWF